MSDRLVRAADLERVERLGCVVVELEGEGIALFSHEGRIFAVDKRCPHMGFPLERGTVADGILTCHWHHARYDLASGGTFDLWADDLRAYPTVVRDGEVWVDLAPRGDPILHQHARLRDGLEHDIPLVIAKAVLHLLAAGEDPAEPFRTALNFGTRYSVYGWGPGLTMLTALANLGPRLDGNDRARALYQGIAAVSQGTAGDAPRFTVQPLPAPAQDVDRLKVWFRRFVEVRDAEGAERCVVSALRAGATGPQMADLILAAATDHRYLSKGHVADFTNKAFEALDMAGWDYAPQVLTSLVRELACAERMEEANAWRHPVDLVAIVDEAVAELPAALQDGRGRHGWDDERALVEVLLGEDPRAAAAALLDSLRDGAAPEQVAQATCQAALLRIARFHTSNEFPDWDTALHTLSFANALHASLRRVPSPDVLRGVFDAAMSVYLDRFLNVPAAPVPAPEAEGLDPDALLATLPELLDEQQRVNQAGETVARYLAEGGAPDRLVAMLGRLLLREDRNFHTIQAVEACVRQALLRPGTRESAIAFIAGARYLAAHSPTVRAQNQTFQIALRLQRGEHLHEAAATAQPTVAGPGGAVLTRTAPR